MTTDQEAGQHQQKDGFQHAHNDPGKPPAPPGTQRPFLARRAACLGAIHRLKSPALPEVADSPSLPSSGTFNAALSAAAARAVSAADCAVARRISLSLRSAVSRSSNAAPPFS